MSLWEYKYTNTKFIKNKLEGGDIMAAKKKAAKKVAKKKVAKKAAKKKKK